MCGPKKRSWVAKTSLWFDCCIKIKKSTTVVETCSFIHVHDGKHGSGVNRTM